MEELTPEQQEEINKYLTQKKGQCWHDWARSKSPYKDESVFWKCKKCHVLTSRPIQHDFFTWQGFGNLITWARRQEFWPSFVTYNYNKAKNLALAEPALFACALYHFLKRRARWN